MWEVGLLVSVDEGGVAGLVLPARKSRWSASSAGEAVDELDSPGGSKETPVCHTTSFDTDGVPSRVRNEEGAGESHPPGSKSRPPASPAAVALGQPETPDGGKETVSFAVYGVAAPVAITSRGRPLREVKTKSAGQTSHSLAVTSTSRTAPPPEPAVQLLEHPKTLKTTITAITGITTIIIMATQATGGHPPADAATVEQEEEEKEKTLLAHAAVAATIVWKPLAGRSAQRSQEASWEKIRGRALERRVEGTMQKLLDGRNESVQQHYAVLGLLPPEVRAQLQQQRGAERREREKREKKERRQREREAEAEAERRFGEKIRGE
ncbi:hypothetical protein BU16DRAFT_584042 [Lophium mytilinum]|uniref:Uncharacterized protein n=1 Tax=Lophium mytilinum TaxID=390894 RepID=A0A6A6QLZ9_9PEZI|nr:hypothetical protein BU16DRAFT_584042 [Lophium mytilinum]